MHDSTPYGLTTAEWDEVAAVEEVRENWGFFKGETGADLAQCTYGARFNFCTGMPGYSGDLFVVAGDGLSAPPMTLIRRDGRLRALTDF
jgi:hypothetical protein